MEPHTGFAVLDEDGNFVQFTESLATASKAITDAGNTPVMALDPTPEREQNRGGDNVWKAWLSSRVYEGTASDPRGFDVDELLAMDQQQCADLVGRVLLSTTSNVVKKHRKTQDFATRYRLPSGRLSAVALGDALLGSNQKLDKGIGLGWSVTGLALQPHRFAFGAKAATGLPLPPSARANEFDFDEAGPIVDWEKLGVKGARLRELSDKRSTFCSRATSECRAVCLLYSGQQTTGDVTQDDADFKRKFDAGRESQFARNMPYNYALKKARSTALLAYPRETLSLILNRLRDRIATALSKGSAGISVRLNVLSDIPWELVLPGLFTHPDFVGARWYDYTKIPERLYGESRAYTDRTGFENYHLTFSFSGTNMQECIAELAHRNVAIPILGVFSSPSSSSWGGEERTRDEQKALRKRLNQTHGTPVATMARGSETKERGYRFFGGKGESTRLHEFPSHFNGYPVIDGDHSDLRFLDSPQRGAWVGLRFKLPLKLHRKQGDVARLNFVVKATVVEDEAGFRWVFAPETPACTGAVGTHATDEGAQNDEES